MTFQSHHIVHLIYAISCMFTARNDSPGLYCCIVSLYVTIPNSYIVRGLPVLFPGAKFYCGWLTQNIFYLHILTIEAYKCTDERSIEVRSYS